MRRERKPSSQCFERRRWYLANLCFLVLVCLFLVLFFEIRRWCYFYFAFILLFYFYLVPYFVCVICHCLVIPMLFPSCHLNCYYILQFKTFIILISQNLSSSYSKSSAIKAFSFVIAKYLLIISPPSLSTTNKKVQLTLPSLGFVYLT